MLSGREYAEHNIGTDYGDDVDWWDEMINHKNFSTKHHLSLQYGTEKAQVYTSLYYEKQDGIAIVDSRKDYGGRVNANFKLFNNPTRSPYDSNSETGYNIWQNETLDYNVVADAKLYTYEGVDKWF